MLKVFCLSFEGASVSWVVPSHLPFLSWAFWESLQSQLTEHILVHYQLYIIVSFLGESGPT